MEAARRAIGRHLVSTTLVVSAVLAGAGIAAEKSDVWAATISCAIHGGVYTCTSFPAVGDTVNITDFPFISFTVSRVNDPACNVDGYDTSNNPVTIYVGSYGTPPHQCDPCAGGSGVQGSAAGCRVGGRAELSGLQQMNSEKSKGYTTPIAGGVAAALALVTATGAALYTRRNRSARYTRRA